MSSDNDKLHEAIEARYYISDMKKKPTPITEEQILAVLRRKSIKSVNELILEVRGVAMPPTWAEAMEVIQNISSEDKAAVQKGLLYLMGTGEAKMSSKGFSATAPAEPLLPEKDETVFAVWIRSDPSLKSSVAIRELLDAHLAYAESKVRGFAEKEDRVISGWWYLTRMRMVWREGGRMIEYEPKVYIAPMIPDHKWPGYEWVIESEHSLPGMFQYISQAVKVLSSHGYRLTGFSEGRYEFTHRGAE